MCSLSGLCCGFTSVQSQLTKLRTVNKNGQLVIHLLHLQKAVGRKGEKEGRKETLNFKDLGVLI